MHALNYKFVNVTYVFKFLIKKRNLKYSREVKPSLDHSLCVLGLRTLNDWLFFLLANLFTDLVVGPEAHTLVVSHGQFVLVLQVIRHPFVFEPIFLHLRETGIFFRSLGFIVYFFPQSAHS